MKYNNQVVVAFFKECGLPEPELEYPFAASIGRKWRFDFAWVYNGVASWKAVALEVDGGIWIKGGHNRGAQMLKTWEKENEAACRGWRILRCQPKDLCTQATIDLIKRCLQ